MEPHTLDLRALDAQLDQLLLMVGQERIRRALPADAESLSNDRRTLEARLKAAFEETDVAEMPAGWSIQRAALLLAEYVVEQMLLELRDGENGLLH